MANYPIVKLGDLCRIEKGQTGIQSAIPGEYPLVTTGPERKSANSYQFDTAAVCIPLVSSTGHGKKSLNYVHFQEGKFALGTILAAIIPNDPTQLNAAFLQRYLQFFKDTKLVSLMKGAANVSLSMRDIGQVEIPLPPIGQQNKFIEVFNRATVFSDQLLHEFDKQLLYVAQLRQTILQEAIEGKLTAQWRAQHPVQPGNPEFDAAALLATIKAEKQKLIAEKKIGKEKPLPPIREEEVPFDLPEGWVWCRLGEIIKESPKNGYSPKPSTTETRTKSLKLGATTSGKFLATEIKYIDETIPEDSAYWLEPDDILIQRSNSLEHVGVSAVFTGDRQSFIYPDLMMKIRLFCEIKSEFAHKVLSSPYVRQYYRDNAKGVQKSMPKINQGIVNNTLFSLPPLAEQRAIVERVDRLLALVDELAAQVAERKSQANALMQAVLREAFVG